MRLQPTVALSLLACLSIAGCSPASTGETDRGDNISASPAPAESPPAIDYAGRWTGVEGMFLDVRPGTAPATYRLTMQYDLDHRVTVDARREGDALAFTRDGERKALRPSDGTATGLKYLAGKHDCLTVAPGEGYCRD